MPLTDQQKNLHLMWRAGFGPAVEQLADISGYSPRQVYKGLVKASSKKPDYINVADDYLQGLYMGIEEAGRQQRAAMDKEEKKKIQQKNREDVRNLNLTWMGEMVNSSSQLREKMAFFWHGHFACRNLNIFYQQNLLDIIRKNALGHFGDLLKEVSKSAAMLNFLNNQQNRKDHPNENFARELMELFTLGRGNYTEQDVKEAARAFTGWGSTLKGEFVFRRFQHDTGGKTVLGKSGKFSGEEVLNILLGQKQTARFITGKIYRFFVNENIDKEKTDWLTERFYQSNYDISRLMEDIFTSEWFYEEKNIGARIKSPVELLTGMQRILPMELENPEMLLVLQRVLGQLLFYPPNVAGWPGGTNWIDSSSLMMRLRIPQLVVNRDELNVRPKDDDDQLMGRLDQEKDRDEDPKAKTMNVARKLNKVINAKIDWDPYLRNFESVPREELVVAVSNALLQTKNKIDPDLIKQYADPSGRENFIKTATIQIMSTPEYQLC